MTTLMLWYSATALMLSESPVKMTYILMFMCFVAMFQCLLEKSMVWYPLMFFMLFMGGVLIMFLILSSVSPNQKMEKKEYEKSLWKFVLLIAFGFLITTGQINHGSNSIVAHTKSLISEDMNVFFFTILILVYFFIFVSMTLTEKTSLRSEVCFL